MSGFWDGDLGMEDECQRIMESIRGEEANKGRNAGANGGRMWVCCLSCGRVAVLVRQGWVGRKQEQAAKEKNRFVESVCGGCERRNGEVVGGAQGGRVEVQMGMIRGSREFRAIAGHCSKMGWEDVEVSSERIVDRRTLLGKHWAGMTIRSVRIEEAEGEGWDVKVMDYLDVGFV
jgi:hypothetical protein